MLTQTYDTPPEGLNRPVPSPHRSQAAGDNTSVRTENSAGDSAAVSASGRSKSRKRDTTATPIAIKTCRCALSGREYPQDRCLRFGLSPDGTLTPDLFDDLPGPGFYIPANKTALAEALKTNPFGAQHIPEDCENLILDRLREQALGYLALARRAGACTQGFAKCMDILKNAANGVKACVYVTAAPKESDSRKKLAAAAPKGSRTVDLFTNAELSEKLGRGNAVHIVLEDCGLTRAFLRTVDKLTHLTTTTSEPAGKNEND